MKSHYEILGIEVTASKEEIKKAYFDLAKKYHPDSGDAAEVQKFHQLTEAYKTLSDVELRRAYDLTLKVGLDKIDEAEAEILKETPVDPYLHDQKRDPFREDELREFYRNRFKKAVFRVILLTLFFSLLGAFFGLLLEHPIVLTGAAGLLIGFSLSVRQNFDLSTFFSTPRKQKMFQGLVWFLFALGVLYFVFLVVQLFLK